MKMSPGDPGTGRHHYCALCKLPAQAGQLDAGVRERVLSCHVAEGTSASQYPPLGLRVGREQSWHPWALT